MISGPQRTASVGGIEVSLSGEESLAVKLVKPDRFLSDEFPESLSRQDLSYTDLLQLERLEGLYGRWLRAKSVNARSAAMHRAVLEIQPGIADLWAPIWSSRREDCGRRRFRDTLQMISMLRRRGFDLVFSDMELITNFEGGLPGGDTAAARTSPRRCEGRSRAPAAGGGGSRRGGSRRGGGDRGDDSGGDGGSGSDGDGSGGQSPASRLWQYLGRLAIIATIFGGLYTPASDLIARASEDRQIHKEGDPRRKADPAGAQSALPW